MPTTDPASLVPALSQLRLSLFVHSQPLGRLDVITNPYQKGESSATRSIRPLHTRVWYCQFFESDSYFMSSTGVAALLASWIAICRIRSMTILRASACSRLAKRAALLKQG